MGKNYYINYLENKIKKKSKYNQKKWNKMELIKDAIDNLYKADEVFINYYVNNKDIIKFDKHFKNYEILNKKLPKKIYEKLINKNYKDILLFPNIYIDLNYVYDNDIKIISKKIIRYNLLNISFLDKSYKELYNDYIGNVKDNIDEIKQYLEYNYLKKIIIFIPSFSIFLNKKENTIKEMFKKEFKDYDNVLLVEMSYRIQKK